MQREEILDQLWQAQDEAYDLMAEYDSLPHYYGQTVLYQAEAYIINSIGQTPGITTTEIADALKKTTSACSQIVSKLVSKGLVEQIRNKQNKRQYNLQLTPDGRQVYEDHIAFNKYCQQMTFEMLSQFSDEELAHHVMVQRRINEAYREDVRKSRKLFVNPKA